MAAGQISSNERIGIPFVPLQPDLANDFDGSGRTRFAFSRFRGSDGKSKRLIQPDNLRRGAQDEAILRRQLNGLFTLERNLLDCERGEIVGVTIVRNAEDPVAELESGLQLACESVHANGPNMEWNGIEPRVLLVR